MEKNTFYLILTAIVGIVAGVVISGYAANNSNYPMMNMMGMSRAMQMMQANDQQSMANAGMHGTNMGMSMNTMSSSLSTLKGDRFDQTFLNLMIDHHQGAIDMANLAASNSNRDELKALAKDIITAQTQEINMMTDWLNTWF